MKFLYKIAIITALFSLVLVATYKYGNPMNNISPPKAKKHLYTTNHHAEDLNDNYDWLRDKNWPKVESSEILNYLNLENDYYKAHENKALEKIIYDELRARVQEEDESYPIKKGSFQYFTKMIKDKDYPLIYRKSDLGEEILLDCNELAKDKSSFAMGTTNISKDHKKMAYSYDSDGSERYSIYVKDLSSKKDLNDVITNAIGNIVWNDKGDGFYYTPLTDNWRRDRVFYHQLGTKQDQDTLIYQELDQTFSVGIGRSSSYEYLFIESGNSTSNETRYLSLSNSNTPLKTTIERKADHLYQLDHIKNNFYILTNDMGKNFRLVSLEEKSNFTADNFNEIIPHNSEKYLLYIDLYDQCIAVVSKVLGINKIDFYNIDDHKFSHSYNFEEEIYEANISYTSHDDQFIRIQYSSLTKPQTILEYDFKTRESFTRKVVNIPSGHDSSLYESKRLWVESIDGVKVPISMVYRKDKIKDDSPNSLLLYGYGSYGYGMPLSFRSNIISLLDRGFIYVIAHIRGGDELGFNWYEDAKFLTKKLTFEDFISVSKYLIKENHTSPDKLHIMGGSAGGMLMGTVVNQNPELYKSVVALVPFVDVLNTMLDDSLPLTPGEFEEWGNPITSKEYFDYIKSYSPYDNVKEQHYPDILVTAGLTDPRVGYWEAAKWVAKLREYKQDNNLLLLKTEMDSGHKGQSGRFKGLEEVAMIYSFILRESK